MVKPLTVAEIRTRQTKVSDAGDFGKGFKLIGQQLKSLDVIRKIESQLVVLNELVFNLEKLKSDKNKKNADVKTIDVKINAINTNIDKITAALQKERKEVHSKNRTLPKELDDVIDKLQKCQRPNTKDLKGHNGDYSQSKKLFKQVRAAIPVIYKDKIATEADIIKLNNNIDKAKFKKNVKKKINSLATVLEDKNHLLTSDVSFKNHASELSKILEVYKVYCVKDTNNSKRQDAIGKVITVLNNLFDGKIDRNASKIDLDRFKINLEAISLRREQLPTNASGQINEIAAGKKQPVPATPVPAASSPTASADALKPGQFKNKDGVIYDRVVLDPKGLPPKKPPMTRMMRTPAADTSKGAARGLKGPVKSEDASRIIGV